MSLAITFLSSLALCATLSAADSTQPKPEAPVFSMEGGFYSGQQKLELSTQDKGLALYYTTDGSEPTRQKTQYKSSITLTKSTPVRARSYASDGDSSACVTQTFFISERVPSLPVVSIVTDSLSLFDKDSGIYVAGPNASTMGMPGGGMPPMGGMFGNRDSMRRGGPFGMPFERDSLMEGGPGEMFGGEGSFPGFGGEMGNRDSMDVFRGMPPMQEGDSIRGFRGMRMRGMRGDMDSLRMKGMFAAMDSLQKGGMRFPGGMPVRGSNPNSPNYEQDWERLANFEYYDRGKQQQINKELNISISGNITRHQSLKSLKLTGNKLFGENRFEYPLFSQKPDIEPKSILLRNSGQDFQGSMMLDGMIQSLACGKINIECQSYQPAVVFINGTYYGIENLRERNNKQYADANYGLKSKEIYFIEVPQKGAQNLEGTAESVADFDSMIRFASTNDMAIESNYQRMAEWVDLESLINYTIIQLYCDNTGDWPDNNYKAFRAIDGGQWRWIVHDLDFGFSRNNERTLSSFLSRKQRHANLIRSLLKNEKFKQRFIDQYAVELGSIYSPSVVNQTIDSIAGAIREEFAYHAKRWNFTNNFEKYVSNFKSFGEKRATTAYNQLKSYFALNNPVAMHVKSDVPEATLTFNGVKIPEGSFNGNYFDDRSVTLKAEAPKGYTFAQWVNSKGDTLSKKSEVTVSASEGLELIATFKKE
ncbi:MAG: CotH kinase family protein [Bacteroidales bacterium]|nr:CotH kinase family protein [Bacteroidales bacterium]